MKLDLEFSNLDSLGYTVTRLIRETIYRRITMTNGINRNRKELRNLISLNRMKHSMNSTNSTPSKRTKSLVPTARIALDVCIKVFEFSRR